MGESAAQTPRSYVQTIQTLVTLQVPGCGVFTSIKQLREIINTVVALGSPVTVVSFQRQMLLLLLLFLLWFTLLLTLCIHLRPVLFDDARCRLLWLLWRLHRVCRCLFSQNDIRTTGPIY